MRDHLSQLLELTAAGVHWRVLPECRSCLLGPHGLFLSDWLAAGQAQVVKHGPHQTVYRVTLPGLNFYLKHYRVPNLRAQLRLWIRPCKARMEYQRALAVAARGVPTVTPLALGEQCGGAGPGESFLITRALENTEPLSAFVEKVLLTYPPARQARLRQRLAEALGELVARMHDAGILHQDLHPGNILVQLGEDDQTRLYLIDLHPVFLGRPLNWRASRGNLVILNRWFMVRAGRSDRLRFWGAYNQARRTGPWAAAPRDGLRLDRRSPAVRSLAADRARQLEQLGWASNLAFWRHRDGRSISSGRYYKQIGSGAVHGFAVSELGDDVLAGLLANPDGPFSDPDAVLVQKSAGSTEVELDLMIHGRRRRVLYTRFEAPGWTFPGMGLLRRPVALQAWVCGHGLRERLLASPRPLVVLMRRSWGLQRQSYLLVEKVEEAVGLGELLADLQQLPASDRRLARRNWLERVAVLLRDLHGRNLSHGALDADNLLVTHSPEQIWVTNLAATALHRRLPRSRRVQDLSRLCASLHGQPGLARTDKIRFLRTYLRCGPFNRDCWKKWWRDIARATQELLSRSGEADRPLSTTGIPFKADRQSRLRQPGG